MASATIDDIKSLVAIQLGVGSVNDSDRIVEDLGAESSDVANIVSAVEDKYGISVPEDKIKSISTVRDVFVAVQNA
jgi:acyl carrier protein